MRNWKQMISAIGQSFQKGTDWILGAVKRLFSPSDDDYPQSGVQPFEGDIPDAHHHDSSW
ncbi:MAG: hypothetical protein AAGA75_14810 [Cyanobacteria bacterium P01_E01_bin.6]